MAEQITFQTIFQFLQTVGILVGVYYYIMTIRTNQRNQEIALRNQELTLKTQEQALETRQAQLFMQVFSQLSSTEKWREYLEILELEWDDYIDFQKKYGVLSGNLDTYAMITSLWWAYTTVGNLVSENLIDIKRVYGLLDSMPVIQWKKWEPVILELRKRIDEPDAYFPFEYLARELEQLKAEGYVEEIKTKLSLDI
jgi:hypothetical protein